MFTTPKLNNPEQTPSNKKVRACEYTNQYPQAPNKSTLNQLTMSVLRSPKLNNYQKQKAYNSVFHKPCRLQYSYTAITFSSPTVISASGLSVRLTYIPPFSVST